MVRSLAIALILFLFTLFGASMPSQQDKGKSSGKPPELIPRRTECSILLPERGERYDIARLVRADQFLDCERDGFPKHLAPPWKETVDAEKKLGDACEYFASKSVKEYPQLSREALNLAADRCHINVVQIILMKMTQGLGQPQK